MSLDELYQELILDHYKNPRCQGCLEGADAEVELHNPLCGDRLKFTAKFNQEILEEIRFTGSGCAISQATASVMSELLIKKNRDEIARIARLFRAMMRGEVKSEELDSLGDALALEGVRKFSARIKCALLAWDCIERILKDSQSDKKEILVTLNGSR